MLFAKRFTKIFIYLLVVLEVSTLNAQDKAHFQSKIEPLLEKFCYDCHDEDTQKGDMQLDILDPDMINGKDGAHWHAILDILNSGDMPPAKKKKQPSDSDRRILISWLTKNIELAKKMNKGKVQSVLRRLTRGQYSNSLNDILNINLNVVNALPPDSPSAMGFLNDSAKQFASPLLLETYEEIAREAVKKAIGPAKKPPITRYRIDFGKDISENSNSSKGGFQAIALSGKDFIPYVVDADNNILNASDNTDTNKNVNTVLKQISVGLRGSRRERFHSIENALQLYAANPQRNKTPNSWRPPNPNVKLLIRHEFPTEGRFRYTIKASNSVAKRIDPYYAQSVTNRKGQPLIDRESKKIKYPAQVKWVSGNLNYSKDSIVITAQQFYDLDRAVIKNKTLVPEEVGKHRGAFKAPYHLQYDGYYQIDLVRTSMPKDRKDFNLNLASGNLGNTKLSFKFSPQSDHTIKNSANTHIKVLFNGFFKAGKGNLSFYNQLPPITHLVITPLKGKYLNALKIPRDKEIMERNTGIKLYQKTPAVIRAFMGSRGDDGENFNYLDGYRVVKGNDGMIGDYTFEGRLENFPLPAIEKNDKNNLAGILVLGIYNHHLASKTGGIGPILNIHQMTFEAPYFESWPPKSYVHIFGSTKPKKDNDSTRQLIKRFLNLSFRKEVEKPLLDKYYNFWKEMEKEPYRYEDTVAEVLIAILCSPEFIFIAEPQKIKTQKESKINEYQLANKLSYFLWNRGPDASLLNAAVNGSLRSNLDHHLERLLDHDNSLQFIKAFGAQWLAMGKLQIIEHTKELRKEFNTHIKEYLSEETYTFLKYVLDKNLSIKNFIDSDFVMLNEHLANYYKIDGVKGYKFRPFKVDRKKNRGGLISQASFLVGHSDGKDGHPIKRGVWLMKKFLASEPPPPPPNVPELDEKIPGFEEMTVRQKLEVHSKKISCKDCHAKIDPWGIAFEQYNALGHFNEGAEAKSTLPGGKNINGIAELKEHLLTFELNRVVLSVVEHLTSYSLGRELSYLDEEDIQEIITNSKANNYRFRDIIKALVKHDIFHRL